MTAAHRHRPRTRLAAPGASTAHVASIALAAALAVAAVAALAGSPLYAVPAVAPAPAPASSPAAPAVAPAALATPTPATAAHASSAAPAAAASDPWGWLSRVRHSLVEGGPTGASFSQTYIPAGFTSGEKESGSLSLHLPDCLRWDYLDPYPKGFLLCGDLVHAWNSEDHTGHRYHVDRKNEPGLDLLLLSVGDLKARYDAVTRSAPNGQVLIALSPKARQGQLADASLAIDPATLRIVEVTYHDREGNLTRFQIGSYAPLSRPGQFTPPDGIHWEEQQQP
jgi:outer membrane lipoprotein-sorting protein